MRGSGGIDRVNERSRSAARQVGRPVYQHQVIESWPGCVDCGRPIRWSVPSQPYRTCGCPARLWRCAADGWVVAWSVMASVAALDGSEADDDVAP